MTVQRDGHRLLACKMRIFPTNKQRQIAVISIRMPHFPGNICLFSCIIDFPYFRESHIARIKDTFDPKKTSYVVFHSANKNTLGPALPLFRRSLARANHVSVKVVEVTTGRNPRAVLLNYARGSYHFSFFENNTKRESLFWLCVLTLIFIGWSVFRFKSPENIEGSSSA